MAAAHHPLQQRLVDRVRQVAAHRSVRRVRLLANDPRATDSVLLALAAAVGFATGLLAVALIEAVELVQRLVWGPFDGGWPTMLAVLLIPALGGLTVGILFASWLPQIRGGGVSEVMRDVALHGGRMPGAVPPAKLAATAINLGTGASGGREGPIVQIGGAVGSLFGRMLTLDEEQKRALIAAGAGAGIAASFNAPIGGMLFALEVIIGGFRARYLQLVVVASVVGSVTAREIAGPGLIYSPPSYALGDPRELILYAVLGLAAAAVGVAFIRTEDAVSQFSSRLRMPVPARMALGGLVVGLIALALPTVLGSGDHLPPIPGIEREPIADLLRGGIGGFGPTENALVAAGLLLVLVVAKLVATAFTIGTGNSAGSFAPAIFMGAALGTAFGNVAATLLPNQEVAPGAFALVGMAGVVGASVRAPLAAVLLAFELTGDYALVLPLMLTTGIAVMAADRVQRESIYTLPLRRRGIVYGEPEDVDIMQTVQVGEVMTRNPETVPPNLPLDELHEQFRRTRHHGFPVVEHGRLVGVVTLADVTRVAETTGDLMAPGGPGGTLRVRDVCTTQPLTVTPSDPVFRAVRRMAALDVGRLPVVAEEDHGRLVGLVRRADVVKAYQRAVTRSLAVQQREASSRLRDLGGTQFVELVIDGDSAVVGCRIRDVQWPPRTLVTSIRRAGDVVMPRGDTVLRPGDELVVLAGRDSVASLQPMVAARAAEGS
jgi:CIC family chloride channel protein